MKFSLLLFGACSAIFIPSSSAADPSDCSGTDKERTGSDFKLQESPDNPHLSALATKLANRKVNVATVLSSANHALTKEDLAKPIEAYKWEHTSEFNDETTEKWVPQGITSTADALGEGTYEGKTAWVVSWHRGGSKADTDSSARVTFVDQDTNKYRHAMLVNPTSDDNFEAVPVHAGGIVWYGNTLWVVDSHSQDGAVGFRVFDLSNIWTMDSDGGDKFGKSGNNYFADGYLYAIPQIRSYTWIPSFGFQFSFVSLDRTDTPDTLLVGEYHTQTEDAPRRFVKWELDYTTRKLKTNAGVAAASWAYCVGIDRMQGAVSAHGKFYISRSEGSANGDLWAWGTLKYALVFIFFWEAKSSGVFSGAHLGARFLKIWNFAWNHILIYHIVPGNAANNNNGFFPPSSEDLSFDSEKGVFYTLTERLDGRYILAYKASQVDF
jgi:hypothetical protein